MAQKSLFKKCGTKMPQTHEQTAELKNGILRFLLKNNLVSTNVNLWLGLSYCDGKWNKVILKKEGLVISASVNELTEKVVEPGLENLIVNSPVYIGGIPDEIQDAFQELGLEQGFGGCMKDVKFTRGAVVNLASVSSSAVRVNLDGCLSTDSAVNCRGNDSIVVYQGKEQSVYDSGLQPFSEYLYRVIASNKGGSVSSAWNRGRTREPVPQNVPTPSRVHSINGYSVEVTWDEPVGVIGVIEKYILKASSEDGSSTSPVSTEISNTSALTANKQLPNWDELTIKGSKKKSPGGLMTWGAMQSGHNLPVPVLSLCEEIKATTSLALPCVAKDMSISAPLVLALIDKGCTYLLPEWQRRCPAEPFMTQGWLGFSSLTSFGTWDWALFHVCGKRLQQHAITSWEKESKAWLTQFLSPSRHSTKEIEEPSIFFSSALQPHSMD
uniref:Uncharacterized protein n=1 Tax=Sphaerodactylus townsendi TaxID=933632 RepID=A0ACB8GA91_9SAUR